MLQLQDVFLAPKSLKGGLANIENETRFHHKLIFWGILAIRKNNIIEYQVFC